MERIYKGLGSVTGRFYNSHTRVEDWKQAPGWVNTHYRMEEEQQCGDITPALSGALQGAVNAVAEFAKLKDYRTNPDVMGAEIAKHAGIKDVYGKAFATGFLETAHLKGEKDVRSLLQVLIHQKVE